MGQAASLALSIGVPLAGGFLGSIVSQKDVLTWYQKLDKPRWTPPTWLFGPMWTVLYITQGTASWLVWQRRGPKGLRSVATPLGLYAAQLVFNLIWNPLMFKTHKTDVATVDAAAILGLATAATVFMSRATSPAVQLPLMVPYLVWTAYATALSANICYKNPTERLFKTKRQRAKEARGDYAPSALGEATTAAKQAVKAVSAASEAVAAGRDVAVHASKATDAVAAPLKEVTGTVSTLLPVLGAASGTQGEGGKQAGSKDKDKGASSIKAGLGVTAAVQDVVGAVGSVVKAALAPAPAGPQAATGASGMPTGPLTTAGQVEGLADKGQGGSITGAVQREVAQAESKKVK